MNTVELLQKRRRQARYMIKISDKIERVIQMQGYYVGPLAELFCVFFCMYAKRIPGMTLKEASSKLEQRWHQITPDGQYIRQNLSHADKQLFDAEQEGNLGSVIKVVR